MVTHLKQFRFRPHPLATLTAVAFTTLFASLGVWQLQRADEKRELAAEFERQRALPAVDLSHHAVRLAEDRYRQATVTGVYAAGDQILVDSVVLDGRPGYQVFAPLRIAGSGNPILVDRGWVPQGATRADVPEVAIPGGEVTIDGWLDQPRSKPVIVAGDIDADQTLWPFLDVDALSARSGLDLPAHVIHAAEEEGLRTKAPEFSSNVGMHIGYAIQWFAFAAVAAGTYLALNLKKSA